MTISWIFVKDFKRLITYQKERTGKKAAREYRKRMVYPDCHKLVYIILLGVVLMHYIAGFMLAVIFQPAHVIDGTEYPLPDENNALENNWEVHQLKTTTNFGNKSRWFSWYVGGLNFQIEHHLFPNVCHVHYRKIASIVKTRHMNLICRKKVHALFLTL